MDDLNPTLLESVSAFLPANCVFRDRLLGDNNTSTLSVEGIWPAWNPFLSETTDLTTTDTLPGSAMSLLGLSTSPAALASGGGGGNFFGDEGALGGVQSPPTELRIVTSHARSGYVTLLEFPLWADPAWTTLELAPPVRRVLAIHKCNALLCCDGVGTTTTAKAASARQPVTGRQRKIVPRASMDYDSSRLVAELSRHPDSKSNQSPSQLHITWHRPGTMAFLPHNWLPEDAHPERAEELLKNCSSTLRDESLVPVPLALPSIEIPTFPAETNGSLDDETTFVSGILWWPESRYGGCPLLVVIMSNGTVIVFEVAPPSGSSEPPLPLDCGKPQPSVIEISGFHRTGSLNNFSTSDDGGELNDDLEYEVLVTPDSEYGLGLRLESQVDGMCAIAGSYKRHPLTGEALPAEKTGTIQLGDELIKANDVDLQDRPFDDNNHCGRSGCWHPLRSRQSDSDAISAGSVQYGTPQQHPLHGIVATKSKLGDLCGPSTELAASSTNNGTNAGSQSEGRGTKSPQADHFCLDNGGTELSTSSQGQREFHRNCGCILQRCGGQRIGLD